MRWLTSLPVGVLVGGALVVAAIVAAASRAIVVALVPEGERDRVQSIAAPLMPALGATFAVFTALALTSEAGYLRAAQDIVSHEAADASRLGWASTTPGLDSDAIQESLADYLRATRAGEWRDADPDEAADPATAAAIARMERSVRDQARRPALGTPASTELLASVDAVTTDRRDRIAAASRELPVLYVVMLSVAGIALVANAAALTVRVSLRTSLLTASLAAVVALSLALLLAISAPWDGPLVVSGHPLDAVVRDVGDGFFVAGGG